jgi:pimeloyl-ACP methyl ester carboxylesterase
MRARLLGVAAKVALGVPRLFARAQSQDLQSAVTTDGVRIAWAATGGGHTVIYVLGWATHLQEGLASPLYDRDRIIRDMSAQFQFVRYDGRGCGMSERNVGPMNLQTRLYDLEAVIEATGARRVSLLAYSAGVPTAIRYAAAHPERVERVVLNSGMLCPRQSWDSEMRTEVAAMLPLLERHWDEDIPAYRSWLVSRVDPRATAVETRVMGEFLRVSMNGRDLVAFIRSDMHFDVTEEAGRVTAPTLVIVNRNDPYYPLEQGGLAVAGAIPGARLHVVESDRHLVSASNDRAAFEATWTEARAFLTGGT